MGSWSWGSSFHALLWEIETAKLRQKRNGEPLITFDLVPCKNRKLRGKCHQFNRYTFGRGYGRISFKGKKILAHRYVWEKVHGPIPAGFEIDHQCQNKACINLDHLRLVTHQVNTTENLEGANWQKNKAKKRCPQGHRFTKSNTRVRIRRNGKSIQRECKICARKGKQARKKAARRRQQ